MGRSGREAMLNAPAGHMCGCYIEALKQDTTWVSDWTMVP